MAIPLLSKMCRWTPIIYLSKNLRHLLMRGFSFRSGIGSSVAGPSSRRNAGVVLEPLTACSWCAAPWESRPKDGLPIMLAMTACLAAPLSSDGSNAFLRESPEAHRAQAAEALHFSRSRDSDDPDRWYLGKHISGPGWYPGKALNEEVMKVDNDRDGIPDSFDLDSETPSWHEPPRRATEYLNNSAFNLLMICTFEPDMGSPGTSPTSPAPSSPRPFMRQLSPCAVPQSGKEVVCTVDVGSKPITWLCGSALAHTVETAEVQVDELHVCTALIGSWPRRSPLSSSTPLAPSYALATWSEWPRRRRWYDGRPV